MAGTGKKQPYGVGNIVSWGATVVIIGLLFKIQHWAGGSIFISIGLSAEALLFFIRTRFPQGLCRNRARRVHSIRAGPSSSGPRRTVNPRNRECRYVIGASAVQFAFLGAGRSPVEGHNPDPDRAAVAPGPGADRRGGGSTSRRT